LILSKGGKGRGLGEKKGDLPKRIILSKGGMKVKQDNNPRKKIYTSGKDALWGGLFDRGGRPAKIFGGGHRNP